MLNFSLFDYVRCPGSNGSFGIMNNHQNGIFQLNIGEIKVVKDCKKEFVLLHMDGCPHCVKMLPEWKSATSSNTTSINMRSLERKDDGARDLIEKHGVSSFPTMLLLGGGKLLKKYDGQRNKNSFLDFLRKHD